jgi:uncharacterized C2H2 Zn-finger protein
MQQISDTENPEAAGLDDDEDTTIVCPECGTILKSKRIFANHCYRKHYSIRKKLMRPYEPKREYGDEAICCPACKSILKDRKNYRYHVMHRHKSHKDFLLSLACGPCNKAFATNEEWQRHNRAKHWAPDDESEEEKYVVRSTKSRRPPSLSSDSESSDGDDNLPDDLLEGATVMRPGTSAPTRVDPPKSPT